MRTVRAHPRSRGEHLSVRFGDGLSLGSSPLARGTRKAALDKATLAGLIPARAGNTNNTEIYEFKDRAHPRSRGEHGR